jgi:TIGR03009 family protein
MTRRVLLTCCVAGCLAATLVLIARPAAAQQPQAPGRAKLQNTPAPQTKPRQGATAPPNGAPPKQPATAQPQNGSGGRVQRPQVELKMSKELEDLLVLWEQQSSKVNRLRGDILRFTYDSVVSVEKRSVGLFWYQSPDMGRIDFATIKVPDPGYNPDKKNALGKPYTIESDVPQKWICTGKQIFIIHDDSKIYDKVDIPAQQQGKNIINGPLPFLFGLKAEQAKSRYLLSLGERHYPQGYTEKLANGKTKTWQPQVHIVAVPKLEVDAREWSRAEVMLDAKTFIPRGIKLFNPQGTMETVYLLPQTGMKINEAVWLNNPFNDRPPSNYTIGFDSRAASEEAETAKKK